MKLSTVLVTSIAISMMAIYTASCGNKTEKNSTSGTDTTATEPITNTAQANVNYTDTFTYEFREGTIPIGSGQNYEIKLIPGKVFLSTWSGDGVRSKDSLIIDSARYTAFYSRIEFLNLTSKKATGAACVSGNSEIFTLHANSTDERNGFVFHCDGYNYSNLEGDVEAATIFFKGLIPDLDKRIASARENK